MFQYVCEQCGKDFKSSECEWTHKIQDCIGKCSTCRYEKLIEEPTSNTQQITIDPIEGGIYTFNKFIPQKIDIFIMYNSFITT